MVFTEPSKKIQEFVNKNISLHEFHLSVKSKRVLKKIYNQSTKAYLSKPNYSIVSEKTDDTDFPKSSSYNYIEDSIKTHINSIKKRIIETKLIVGSRTYTIFFIIPIGTAYSIEKYIKKINTWLQVATIYAKPTCSTVVTVYLYLTDLKKVLPKKDGITLNPENANTAFTSSCQPETEIILYRMEEWFKVFIHESFHNLGLDFISTTNDEVKKLLFSIFPIQSEFKLYETYTEMWAEIMNIIFINAENTNKTFEQVLHNVEKHIQTERKFSLFQSAKILDHYGLKYSDLFIIQNTQIGYKEDTEIFCYFILKTLLLYNCNDFIEWLESHQKPVPNKIDKFIKDLIIPRYNEIKFIETIGKVQSLFDKLPDNKTFIETTLRMTALELQ